MEIAASELLTNNRVYPFISLTGGQSCNMTHFTARGGIETFMPLTPIGGRYLELHIVCLPEQVDCIEILSEAYYWRTFFNEPVGSFSCDNQKLTNIWLMGINTLRSCTEDVITDCPIRERGQWTGDSSIVGLRTTACGYGDLQVIKKSLIQATYCTDENGVLPALFPGQTGFFITYGLQWVQGCMDYYKYTGDISLLDKIYPTARRFINYINDHFDLTDGILKDENDVINCGFVDWGYACKDDEMTIPLIGMYYDGLIHLSNIEKALGKDYLETVKQKERISKVLADYIELKRLENGKIDWTLIGYHNSVMLLKSNSVEKNEEKECIDFIKEFSLSCYPNNENAPRLYSPTIFSNQLITPYFYNFTFSALMEKNEELFVFEQIEKCWGYMLDMGETTCIEVFDTRWSHCHQWSACPTWILSYYGLGLHKRLDLGTNHFEFRLITGNIKNANGIVPLADGGKIEVSWLKNQDTIEYKGHTDRDIVIHFPNGTQTEYKSGQYFSIDL